MGARLTRVNLSLHVYTRVNVDLSHLCLHGHSPTRAGISALLSELSGHTIDRTTGIWGGPNARFCGDR